ncbi:UDP-glycosyltransferase 73C6-like [Phragmites australis]|uniref:UDP-glycosyltransferase 73C6-like n=1 Tax=Phragmites australis TaxID=29695 RepID=UPI002D7835D1|nr:UDP-glycosyltransferase 73C6-like [Phragmites australis]
MEGSTKPHFVLVPWTGTISHVIPMTDLGCLLASHGAPVTIVTTPLNAAIAQRRVDRAAPHGAEVTVTAISFPATDAGLPEGCERLDLLRSQAEVPCFFKANMRFGEAVAQYLRSETPRRPSCIISGMCQTWTLGLARDLGVPFYVYHGFGAFALLCIEYLYKHRPHEAVTSADELFDVPALPPFQCRLSSRQLPPHFMPSTSVAGRALQGMREFDMAADGIVVNSFEELEHGSTALLSTATGKTVLAVGPVSLCRSPSLHPQSMPDDARRCMAWLDAKESKSVVYVSFGSIGRMPPAQLMQLGTALVSCPWPVLWVVKGADSMPDDVKKWLRKNTDAEGIASSKCLLMCGWAPQVAILAHPAVGGFMTHCGWGSTLEAIVAGMPMATWPFFAEQFINERLIVDVLGVGVSVGVTKPTQNVLTASNAGDSESEAEVEVGMEQVKKALGMLMDQGAEGMERRKKAQGLKLKAAGALKNGGSSYINLENLIQSLV